MKPVKRIAAAALGAVITLSAAVAARAASDYVHKVSAMVTYKNIKVNVNGEEKGMKVEPFIVYDTVYLPLEAMAKALGKTSAWNAESSTIYVRDRAPDNNAVPISLIDLEPLPTSKGRLNLLGDTWGYYGNAYMFDAVSFSDYLITL